MNFSLTKIFLFAVFLFCGFKALQGFKNRSVERPAGVLVPDEPLQENLPQDFAPVKYRDAVLQPLARYDITARLLSKEKYQVDPGAKYSSWDLAVGWKDMSDSRILDLLRISQSGRFFFVGWDHPIPLPESRMLEQSANMHILPASDDLEKIISSFRVGQIIRMQGYLVRLDTQGGFDWKTSLTRQDTGNGSCELMYVQTANVVF